MWVFTQHGFYSVVAAKPSKDRTGFLKEQGITSDDTHVLVRGRVKDDLEDLKTNYLPDLVIYEDKGADYAFRCYMTREDWKGILAVAVDELDYNGHFKEAARDGSRGAPDRYSAYMSVWSTLNRLQPSKPWSAGSSSWSNAGTGGYNNSLYKGSYSPSNKKDDGQPLGTVRKTWAEGYEYRPETKDYVKTRETKPAEPQADPVKPAGSAPFTVGIVRAMLMGKTTDDFTTLELARMNDEARQLFEAASNVPLSKQPVSRLWLDDQIAVIEAQDDESAGAQAALDVQAMDSIVTTES